MGNGACRFPSVAELAGLPVRRFAEFARLVEYSGLPRSRIEQSTIRFLSKCHAKWRRTVVLRKTRRPTNLLLAEVSGKPQVTFSKLSDVGVEDGFEFRKTTVRRHQATVFAQKRIINKTTPRRIVRHSVRSAHSRPSHPWLQLRLWTARTLRTPDVPSKRAAQHRRFVRFYRWTTSRPTSRNRGPSSASSITLRLMPISASGTIDKTSLMRVSGNESTPSSNETDPRESGSMPSRERRTSSTDGPNALAHTIK